MKRTLIVLVLALGCVVVIPNLVPALHLTNTNNVTQVGLHNVPSPNVVADGNPIPPIPKKLRVGLLG
jgi:hypothetical protein